ncbi:hypothetical protein MSM1_19990 [Mycobacterium sp. SM1]|uniref:hypothetical protein n=1 Tax=Mycobacterium sp. SM1 TaxID=2816243 RepID=UPI001BD12C88|nr:hypothetical protein [Mycobacterium sp. SM1]MBS4729856.1 hypothetical protein [Mycobacterium sp. SM1]MBS4730505.1 hypothetical protein [Mycobacterium sp. SM1]
MELPDRRPPTNYQAFETLSDLHLRKISSRLRLAEWETARDMLRDLYTRDHSSKGSAECAKRIEYLRVAEPVPMIEDFYPGDAPPLTTAKCALTLELVQRQFETSLAGYLTREEVRKKDLEWALNLMEDQKAAEAARRRTSRISGDKQSEPGVFAGFVSVLVQRKNAVQHLVDEHRRPHTRPSGRMVTDARDLERLVNEVNNEVIRLAECLDCYMRSAPFQRLFGDRDDYDEPTPRDVTAAAEAVIDFYKANLLLARTVRGVTARADLVEIIDDIAHLVDRPLEGVDRWITKIVGFAAILPTLEQSSSTDQRERHELSLDLRFDDVLLDRIRRRLDAVPGPLSDAAYIRKWEREFKKSDVAIRKGGDVSLGKHELRVALGFVVGTALFCTSWASAGLTATMHAALAVGAAWIVLSFIAWLCR